MFHVYLYFHCLASKLRMILCKLTNQVFSRSGWKPSASGSHSFTGWHQSYCTVSNKLHTQDCRWLTWFPLLMKVVSESNASRSVSFPFQTQGLELKIRHAVQCFWWTLKPSFNVFLMWWKTRVFGIPFQWS